MFQTQGSGSFTAHQDLIAGATRLNDHESVIDTPSSSQEWGCDAKAGTVTSLITTQLQFEFDKGPFPCFTYPTGTLRDLLDAKGVSWRLYSPPHKGNTRRRCDLERVRRDRRGSQRARMEDEHLGSRDEHL